MGKKTKATESTVLPASWSDLKKLAKETSLPDGNIAIRIHRAISWLKAADESPNADIKFICLWIAFNACYAVEGQRIFDGEEKGPERKSISSFLLQLVALDKDGCIYNILWNRFSSEVRLLLDNEYLFKPFWDKQRGYDNNHKELLQLSNHKAKLHLGNGDVAAFFEILLDRLYVLRNQVFHGGATYNSKVNRQQVNDGHRLMANITPVVIEIMIKNNEHHWGSIYYPVINHQS